MQTFLGGLVEIFNVEKCRFNWDQQYLKSGYGASGGSRGLINLGWVVIESHVIDP